MNGLADCGLTNSRSATVNAKSWPLGVGHTADAHRHQAITSSDIANDFLKIKRRRYSPLRTMPDRLGDKYD
ncbi:hypothetical protein BOTU111922_00495 [Bordetella tumulicola]